jgi:hypothetical protein
VQSADGCEHLVGGVLLTAAIRIRFRIEPQRLTVADRDRRKLEVAPVSRAFRAHDGHRNHGCPGEQRQTTHARPGRVTDPPAA